jgi:signal transduction histidine kinase
MSSTAFADLVEGLRQVSADIAQELRNPLNRRSMILEEAASTPGRGIQNLLPTRGAGWAPPRARHRRSALRDIDAGRQRSGCPDFRVVAVDRMRASSHR